MRERDIEIAVDLFVKIVARADHSQNLPGVGINHDHRAIFCIKFFCILKRKGVDDLLGFFLQCKVKCGGNA